MMSFTMAMTSLLLVIVRVNWSGVQLKKLHFHDFVPMLGQIEFLHSPGFTESDKLRECERVRETEGGERCRYSHLR